MTKTLRQLKSHTKLSLLTFILIVHFSVAASVTVSQSPRRTVLPLFRAPNSSELAAASAANAPIAWSAHQPADALLVVADSSAVGLACLLNSGSHVAESLELSWSIDDVSTGLRRRHTLTARRGAGNSRQTFSLDLGPGIQPASGVFLNFDGSLLNFAFSSPPPGRDALVVACHLRLSGAVIATSSRLRLWDERPTRNSLLDSQSQTGLPCRRFRRMRNLSKLVALDCQLLPPNAPAAAGMVLETAVYSLSSCDSSATAALRSNATDPSGFYAVFMSGRLRLGWLNELSADFDAGNLCVSTDATLPSGRYRVQLNWRLRIEADTNSTGAADEAVFVPEAATEPEVVKIDSFEDPPLTRALPCPYLCSKDKASDPVCRFSWLQSRNGSNWNAAKPPDPAMGSLEEPHRLLLLPWTPPGNPGPPPLAGLWTCRNAASLSAESPAPGQNFRVQVASRPSLCGNRPPVRSVVFVPTQNSSHAWSDSQTLMLNCTVCGLDSALSGSTVSTTDARMRLHGSIGGLDVAADSHSQTLPGGGAELSLRFTRFRLDGKDSLGGSALLRCHALDSQGRGLVAFSSVEALPAPTEAVCQADCSNDSLQQCRLFRCPVEASLSATLTDLGVSVAFLFTIHPHSGAPPQQTLSSEDRLETAEPVSRLRCTQLMYYSDDSDLNEDVRGGRRQKFVGADAASTAAYRTALGERRFTRLLLAVESGWLVLVSGSSVQSDAVKESNPTEGRKYGGDKLSRAVNIFFIITMIICCSAAIFLVIAHGFRAKLSSKLKKLKRKMKDGDAPASSAAEKQMEQLDQDRLQSSENDSERIQQNQQTNAKVDAQTGITPNEDVTATHNKASKLKASTIVLLSSSTPPMRQQMMGIVTTSSSTKATPSSVTLAESMKRSEKADGMSSDTLRGTDGSFVTLGDGVSSVVMSWPLSGETEEHNIEDLIMSTTESASKRSVAERSNEICYRVCPPAEVVAAPARVCDQQLSSVDLAGHLVFGIGMAEDSSSPTVTAARPAIRSDRRRPPARIRVRNRQECHANPSSRYDKAAVSDVHLEDAQLEEPSNAATFVGLFSTPPVPEQLKPITDNATQASDRAKLSCCSSQPPPEMRLAPSSANGVDVFIFGTTTVSTASDSNSNDNNSYSGDPSSCSCSPRSSPLTVKTNHNNDAANSEEVDVPSSDTLASQVLNDAAKCGDNVLFATASTANIDVFESSIASGDDRQQQLVDGDDSDDCTCTCDGCSGCSTCCSANGGERAEFRYASLGLTGNKSGSGEPTDSNVASEQIHLVLQAVSSAMEKLNWE